MPLQDDKPPVLRDFREPNHTRIDNMFVQGGYAAIIKDGALLYIIICQFYNYKTKTSRISRPRIEELSGLSKRHIMQTLKQLSHYNIISYISPHGRGKCTEYTFPHCSTWKPIEKVAHDATFKKSKKRHNVAKKGAHDAIFSEIKGAYNDTKKGHHMPPFKRSSSFKGSSGCSEDLSYSNIGDPDLQKMPVPENGNSASKIALKTTTQIMKNLPQEKTEEEITQRKNDLKQQFQQMQQEG